MFNKYDKKFLITKQQLLYNEGSSFSFYDYLYRKSFCIKSDITLINLKKNEVLKEFFLKKRLK